MTSGRRAGPARRARPRRRAARRRRRCGDRGAAPDRGRSEGGEAAGTVRADRTRRADRDDVDQRGAGRADRSGRRGRHRGRAWPSRTAGSPGSTRSATRTSSLAWTRRWCCGAELIDRCYWVCARAVAARPTDVGFHPWSISAPQPVGPRVHDGLRAHPRRFLGAHPGVVRRRVPRADARPARRVDGDRAPGAHAGRRADRVRQDAVGLPVGDRPARRSAPDAPAKSATGSSTSPRSRRSPSTWNATCGRRWSASGRPRNGSACRRRR